jgi:hypothetical protein
VGGGQDRRLLVVRLLVEDKVAHEDTGTGSDIMQLRRVDVSAYQGMKARIELVDHATGPWGHLLFDDALLRAH